MELLDPAGYRPLARYLAVDSGVFVFQSARLEQHPDGSARHHLLYLEFFRAAAITWISSGYLGGRSKICNHVYHSLYHSFLRLLQNAQEVFC